MVVGLDIGTSCIRVAIGNEDTSGDFKIAGTASEKSVGLRNGNIVNIEAVSNAIKNAIENAEQNAGAEVRSCFTTIGGDQIEGLNATGKVAVSTQGKSQREISQGDIDRVRECAQAVPTSLGRERLHTITQEYIVDGVGGIKDPMHRLGVCLEASVHIITASSTTIQNLRACINRAGYIMDGVMLKTLAAAHAVATEDEMELGSILIDLGAGTTDFLVILNGAPVCTASIPVGGNMVTNDIVLMKGISSAEAERIKVESGCCWMPDIVQDEEVVFSRGSQPDKLLKSELCEIIMARMEEIFTMVKLKIMDKTSFTRLSGNIILTGAGAAMNGVEELVQNIFKTSAVRIGQPGKHGGIEDDYAGSEWATAIGLVLACKGSGSTRDSKKPRKVHSVEKESGGDNPIAKFFKSLF